MKKPKQVSKNFGSRLAAFFIISFFALHAHSDVITENFSTSANIENSNAILNLYSGVIHPPIEINYQVSGPPTIPLNVDVGDGSHGAFEASTYANFGSVVGNLITIDANVLPILKVTRFRLDAGYTLTSINGPLIIYSQSTVEINGIINCTGFDGSPASGALGGAGGLGRCAGYRGGNGGSASQNGVQGLSPADLVGGAGFGGNTGATGGGGGGAGSYSGNSGLSGTAGAGAGGSGGAGVANHDFTILNGSPAGGGGGGSSTEGGGGGGGGGGTVIIRAVGDVTLSTTGVIDARGGNGGAANSGGGGGAGGGGSISVFTAGTLYLLNTTAVIQINVNAGSPGISATGGSGGNGGSGRTWDLFNINGIDPGSGAESVGSGLSNPGDSPPLPIGETIPIRYITTPVTVVSKSFDTQSSLAEFQSITSTPVSPAIVFQVSGSNDNFIADDTGWLNSSQISNLNKKRYIKFRIILTNTNATTPIQVSAVTINFESGIKENFQFKSGCGNIKSPPTNIVNFFIFLFLFLLPVLITLKLRLKTFRAEQKY